MNTQIINEELENLTVADLTPTLEEFKKIYTAANDYILNGEDHSYNNDPITICRKVKKDKKDLLIKYIIIATAIDWTNLIDAAFSALKRFGVEREEVIDKVDEVISDNSAMDSIADSYEKSKKELSIEGSSFLDDEELDESVDFKEAVVEEDIEKHEELNPKLFENEKLKEEVRSKLLEITKTFLAGLAEDEIIIDIKDILFVGSNASYNYTKDSDIDLHIITSTESLGDKKELYDLLYSAYKSMFKNKYCNITLYDIPVEVYVETEGTPRKSNGEYSVLKNVWVKKPEKSEIPEIDKEAFNTKFSKLEAKYLEIKSEIDKILSDSLTEDVALKEELDEKCAEYIEVIKKFIDLVYKLRKAGLANGGEYSINNLLFKEFRNRGYLDTLKELKNKLVAKKLSLKEELDTKINEDREYLTNKEIDEYRYQINKITPFYQAQVTQNKIFHIYNVKEDDVNKLMRILRELPFVKEVSKTPGQWDFSNFTPNMIPKQKYSITGYIK